MKGEILLQGVVGSTAYGFATENSDIDRLGMFAAPTDLFFGLGRPAETHVTTSPDFTLHEAQKWCRLALKCNPTAMELVWLPEYEITSELGEELIGIRGSFLSAQAVRNAYLGYATQQLHKLKNTTYKMDMQQSQVEVRDRRHKHARHLVRLLLQAKELHTEGVVSVRLEHPDWVVSTANLIVTDPSFGDMLIRGVEDIFDKPGVLPSEPGTEAVEAWLHKVRRAHL